MNKKSQSGRSLVEMLGTLTIMGIITMVGLAAFNRAMNGHHANTILYEVNQRVHACVLELNLMNREKCLLAEYPDKIEGKYPVSVEKVNADFFKIKVGEVEKNICTQIKTKGFSLAGKIEPDLCADLNEVAFTLNKNLNNIKQCANDSDCKTVCGTCGEDGFCTNECQDFVPNAPQDCGENDCVTYNEETKTCQYKCVKKKYLESTGTQWINTGFSLHTKTDVVQIRFMPLTSEKTDYEVYFGLQQRIDDVARFYEFRKTRGQKNVSYLLPYDAIQGYQSKKIALVDDEWHQARITDSFVYIDGSSIPLNYSMPSYEYTLPLYLFARNNGGSTALQAVERISDFKVTRNGQNILNMIPVLSPEGEACLFDKVSQKLFCNAGSGEFKTN